MTTPTKAGATFTIDFGAGKWINGSTTKPGPSLTAGTKENIAFLYPAKIESSYSWKDDQTAEFLLRYIESPHTERFTVHFDGNHLSADIMNSFDFGKKKATVTAVMR